MKHFTYSLFAVLALVVLLTSCQPDGVGPRGDDGGGRSIAGGAGDVHPTLDTICKYSDTVWFRSNDGSYKINKCGWDWYDSLPSPCVDPQENWGYMQMYNGYLIGASVPTHWLDVSFALAYGWYCDFSAWQFQIADSIIIDPNTNFPAQTGHDWSSEIFNPMRSEWRVQVPVNTLPQPCFDIACRLSMAPIDVNGIATESYRTAVWAINRNWNLPNNSEASSSEFAIHYCPFGCLENQCLTETNTVCANVYRGITCANTLNSKLLVADASGTTNPVYNWSTGQHTASITVTPNVNTTYTVTVVDGTCNRRITTYDVKVTNVACEVPDHRAEFCPPTLDVRYNETFNIRNYVRMRDNLAVNWNEVAFTYTAVGANLPTLPLNWKLSAFNAGQAVTALAADANTGTGNVARGEYKIFVYRVGQTTYDDDMTIRIHPSRTSTINTGKCSGGVCGYVPGVKICSIPPGQPTNGTSLCVPYTSLGLYNISGLCNSLGGISTNYLGVCGANPCSGN